MVRHRRCVGAIGFFGEWPGEADIRPKRILVGGVLAVAVLGGGFAALRSPPPEPSAAAPVAPPPVSRKAAVSTLRVASGPIRSVLTTHGLIEPLLEVDVAAQTAGKVTAVLFKEGQTVKAGQPLVRLDERTVRAQLAAAKATSDHDRTALERSMRLAQKGIKSAAAVDDSRSTLASSQANEQARAVDLSLMTIAAPFSGVVGPAKVEIGSFVAAGQAVVHLVDRSRLRVSFRLPEKLKPQLRTGLPVEVSAESIGNRVLKGTVTLLDPTVEPDSRSVLLRADLDKAGQDIDPGLFVRIGIILRERSEVLQLPRQALLASLAGTFVYRIENGFAHRVRITTGEREGERVEVVSGLTAGDEVVVTGQFKLEEGMAVETSPFSL